MGEAVVDNILTVTVVEMVANNVSYNIQIEAEVAVAQVDTY